MRDTVVIVAPPDDIHAVATVRAINDHFPSFRAIIVDARTFPEATTLSIDKDGWTISGTDLTIHSREVSAVWWRRRGTHQPSPAIKDAAARQFAAQEAAFAFDL